MNRGMMTINVVAVGLVSLALTACQSSAPTGTHGGRISSTEDTQAELASDKVTNRTLVEFAEAASRQMVRDLADRNIYGISDSDVLVTIVFGDIQNKTRGSVPSGDFEMVQYRIRDTLLGSSLVKQNIRFVNRRQRIEDLNEREIGSGEEDLLQRGGRSSSTTDRVAEYTFYLNGNMFRTSSASKRYYLNFELTNAASTEIVWSSRYEENRV